MSPEFVTLNNGVKMPKLGFGVYLMDDLDVCAESVSEAISDGYRLIDTAQGYNNEEAVGRGIKESGVNRQDLFITTKLWLKSAGYDQTKQAFENSLKKLGTDYLDLYLIHQPFADYHGSWRAMEDLYKEGRIKAIGVSNFYGDRLMDLILNNEIVPAVDQLETHVFEQQTNMRKILDGYHIQLESWGPLSQAKHGVFDNPLLLSLSKKYNKSVAQIVLRWLMQENIVAIPKSIHRQRIGENFKIFDFELYQEDILQIRGLDQGVGHTRTYDPEFVKKIYQYQVN